MKGHEVPKEWEVCLLYINDRQMDQQIEIKESPTFFDALQALKPEANRKTQFQILPLARKTSLKFLHQTSLDQNTINLTFNLPSKSIVVENQSSSEQVCHLLSYLMMKRGNKVLYMAQKPRRDDLKAKRRKKEPLPTMGAYCRGKGEKEEIGDCNSDLFK